MCARQGVLGVPALTWLILRPRGASPRRGRAGPGRLRQAPPEPQRSGPAAEASAPARPPAVSVPPPWNSDPARGGGRGRALLKAQRCSRAGRADGGRSWSLLTGVGWYQGSQETPPASTPHPRSGWSLRSLPNLLGLLGRGVGAFNCTPSRHSCLLRRAVQLVPKTNSGSDRDRGCKVTSVWSEPS